MRTRIVAIITSLSAALGLVAGTLVITGLGHDGSPRSNTLIPVWNTAEVDPTVPAYPAIPTADTLPAGFTAEERGSALLYIEHLEYETECMTEAGFANFNVGAIWQPGLPRYPQVAWQEGLSNAEIERSAAVRFGGPGPGGVPNGAGADYDWRLGGCDGYGWHMAGVDHPY